MCSIEDQNKTVREKIYFGVQNLDSYRKIGKKGAIIQGWKDNCLTKENVLSTFETQVF